MARDSCWSGGDSGCGGHGLTDVRVSVTLTCERCGDPYPARCGCNGNKRPCPRCGLIVFWAGDVVETHQCEAPKIPRSSRALLRFSDWLANEFARERAEGFREGVESTGNG